MVTGTIAIGTLLIITGVAITTGQRMARVSMQTYSVVDAAVERSNQQEKLVAS
jgi:hypothetical protein